MLADLVTARLAAAGVIDRVEGALELNALIESGAMPAAGASAFVVPSGLSGGTVQSATGLFVQDVTETVAVILAVRTAAPAGGHQRGTLDDLISAVIAALAGWEPDGATDVLRLVRGTLLNLRKGVALYQIEFSVSSHLRIAP